MAWLQAYLRVQAWVLMSWMECLSERAGALVVEGLWDLRLIPGIG